MINLKLKEKISNGFLSVFRLVFDQITFKGENMENVQREVLYRPRPVVFLTLFDPNTQKALFVKQVRSSAIIDSPDTPYVVEPVAGIVDEGQTPIEAAIREAKEEANVDLNESDLVSMGECYLSPGISNEYAYFYSAEFDSSNYETGFFGLPSEHEDIQTLLLSSNEVEDLIDKVSVSTLMSLNLMKSLNL